MCWVRTPHAHFVPTYTFGSARPMSVSNAGIHCGIRAAAIWNEADLYPHRRNHGDIPSWHESVNYHPRN